jgi:hypothetical protein
LNEALFYLWEFPAMKKIAAPLLLVCFGIYHFGFFAVQFLMPLAIHQHWESRIWDDEAFSLGGRLVKIPFSMPYGQDQEDFQSVNFTLEIEGQTSRVIKQRYFDEHLEVIVVDDKLQTNLQEQVKNWLFSLSAEAGDSDSTPLPQTLAQSFAKNFIPYMLEWSFAPDQLPSPLKHLSHFQVGIQTGIKDIQLPPPKRTGLP